MVFRWPEWSFALIVAKHLGNFSWRGAICFLLLPKFWVHISDLTLHFAHISTSQTLRNLWIVGATWCSPEVITVRAKEERIGKPEVLLTLPYVIGAGLFSFCFFPVLTKRNQVWERGKEEGFGPCCPIVNIWKPLCTSKPVVTWVHIHSNTTLWGFFHVVFHLYKLINTQCHFDNILNH